MDRAHVRIIEHPRHFKTWELRSDHIGKLLAIDGLVLEMSCDPEIYEKIRGSIAPSIYGYDDVKEALALQLVSGFEKHLPDKGIAAIDEMDKMDNEDKSALHEAMEQQNYHPLTEIQLADGRKVQIGEFVDRLMMDRPLEIIAGKDCEILPISPRPPRRESSICDP